MAQTIKSSLLGFPRIGAQRELKKALESYWKGEINEAALKLTGQELRARHWKLQRAAGIDHIPSNDFSLYDQVLDTTALLGAVPPRYGFAGTNVDAETYFAMARGSQKNGRDVVAMEMTKWFDTNYHYLVPEFTKGQQFKLSSTKIIDEYREARELGIVTRPVLLGPVSYLLLGKAPGGDVRPIDLLDAILPVYREVLERLAQEGAEWIQIDEPCLVLDLDDEQRAAYGRAYEALASVDGIKILLTTYFGGLGDNLDTAVSLPVAGIHIDLVRAPEQLDAVLARLPPEKYLSLGVVDGRNIWKNDLSRSSELIARAVKASAAGGRNPDRLIVASSCSLLHSPVDLENEHVLDEELKGWLAFARQKVDEVAVLARIANESEDAGSPETSTGGVPGFATSGLPGQLAEILAANQRSVASRRNSTRINRPAVLARLEALTDADSERISSFGHRNEIQRAALNLPAFPTTTIGSFPQTQEIREIRARLKKGLISQVEYDNVLRIKTAELIRWQESIGLDVLVHGEYERTDMVEYFGEQLSGYAFTENGWVQSYGSRCVKPPIIYGDVERPAPMTVAWASFAQSLTKLPVKGMLTGPVTILQWSFVRDDQSREKTCTQIALAIRDEVQDLEKAGIQIIQIDEPALREGLPLRKADWPQYLEWAARAFRIASTGVSDSTQIHTHMCYAEFNDIIDSIARLDADVISVETSRSAMELLDAFVQFRYPNEIGPGVYDIHSPRIPAVAEMEVLLRKALTVLDARQIWINPDCGLKTRGWKEVEPALKNMVQAARNVRAEVGA